MSRITLPNIIIGSGVLLLSAGVFFYLGFSAAPFAILTHQQLAATLPALGPANDPSALPANDTSSAGTERYINREHGFAFDYPMEYYVYAFWEEPGYLVTVSRPELKQEFQIFVQPYDRPQLPTTDDISKLLHDFDLKNFEYVAAFGKAGPAITFDKQNARSGRFHDAWFMYDGLIYQVSTPSETRELPLEILASWRYLPLLAP